jgi:predicted dehydrogenase
MESLSRRNFLKTAGLGTAGAILGVQHLSARGLDGSSPAPAKGAKVRLAAIGIANRGAQIIDDFTRTGLCDIVALCDVDPESAESRKTIAKFPKAKLFKDFRKLFDEYADHFDAVCVAIPDFAHFPVAMLALHCGKHVYVEKPMARTFYECELLMDAARRHPELATQVGKKGHSEENYFQFKAWKEAGIIKDVYKIVAHHNDWRRWHPYDVNIKKFPEAEPLPEGMDWDTWLTTAQWHDYNGKYHPGNWRGWFDFGTGAIGDWAAHIIDTCHEFLELGPSSTEVEAQLESGLEGFRERRNRQTEPSL